MNVSKDMYEYLAQFADDRTILTMLSVNKTFNDQKFFERVIRRKYPFLIRFKKEDESYKNFFIKMTYYIAKLEELFGEKYLKVKYTENPEYLYKNRHNIHQSMGRVYRRGARQYKY
tara:strand:- start:1476 stop:1823 length:348 start_codon:yes stop_codon:yes gene_type:complete